MGHCRQHSWHAKSNQTGNLSAGSCDFMCLVNHVMCIIVLGSTLLSKTINVKRSSDITAKQPSDVVDAVKAYTNTPPMWQILPTQWPLHSGPHVSPFSHLILYAWLFRACVTCFHLNHVMCLSLSPLFRVVTCVHLNYVILEYGMPPSNSLSLVPCVTCVHLSHVLPHINTKKREKHKGVDRERL